MTSHISRKELDPEQMEKCMRIGGEFRMCPVDIAAFAAVAFLVAYVIWGIPMTAALAKWCKSKRAKSRARRLSLYDADVEKGRTSDEPDASSEDQKRHSDPYLEPSEQLYAFLRSGPTLPVPPPAYSPPRLSIVPEPTIRPGMQSTPSSPVAAHVSATSQAPTPSSPRNSHVVEAVRSLEPLTPSASNSARVSLPPPVYLPGEDALARSCER